MSALSTMRIDFQPAHALWRRYRPAAAPYRFRAATPAVARVWQRDTRAALSRLIGFQDTPRVPPRPQREHRVDKGDYVRERVVIRTGPHSSMPVYLLIPKGPARQHPAVIAFHGHGYGAKDIVGLWEDGSERDTPDGYHQDFAVKLCRRGFVVAAPEISCFGERQTDFAHLLRNDSPVPTCCTHTAMLAFHLGGSVVGLRALDGRRLIDWLVTRPEVDRRRLGAMGISGGGMHTLFSAALDARIKACVISGYLSTFKGSILAMHHCACNFVPGLSAFGEMADLIGLVAPRPVLIEAGTRDNIFPIAEARAGVAATRRVYRVFGAENAVETDYFEGRHRISGVRAYDFLVKRLR